MILIISMARHIQAARKARPRVVEPEFKVDEGDEGSGDDEQWGEEEGDEAGGALAVRAHGQGNRDEGDGGGGARILVRERTKKRGSTQPLVDAVASKRQKNVVGELEGDPLVEHAAKPLEAEEEVVVPPVVPAVVNDAAEVNVSAIAGTSANNL